MLALIVPRYAWERSRLECCGPLPMHVCWVANGLLNEFLNHTKQYSSVCWIRSMDCISGTHYNRLSWKFTTWAPWVNQSSFRRPIHLHPSNHTNRTILLQCFAVSINTCLYLQVYIHKHMKVGGWAASSPDNFLWHKRAQSSGPILHYHYIIFCTCTCTQNFGPGGPRTSNFVTLLVTGRNKFNNPLSYWEVAMSLYSIIDSYSGMSYQKHEVLITKQLNQLPAGYFHQEIVKKKV